MKIIGMHRSGLLLLLLSASFPLRAQYILNGSASSVSATCYQLTPPNFNVFGSVWYADQVDISEPFDLYFRIFLGCADGNGADGIVFALQQVSTSVGGAGEGMGYQGIQPSFGVEFDTWQNFNQNDPPEDHMAILRNGVVNHASANNLAGPVPILPGAPNLEDCTYHDFRATWNPDSMIFRAYVDCNLRLEYTGDIVNTIFNGNPNVFWGFTSATGGSTNVHRFCLEYISFTEAPRDTAICKGGSVQLRAGGGYQFSWSPSAGLSNPSIPNPVASPLVTTQYVVTITDACNLIRRDTVLITVQDSLNDFLPLQERACNGRAIPLQGPPDMLSYLWSDGSSADTLAVSQPGLYTLQATNACGTFADSTLVLPAFQPSIASEDPDCFGTPGGSALVSWGGTAPFSYLWLSGGALIQTHLNAGPSQGIGGLGAGSYQVLMADQRGCRDTLAFSLSQPPPLMGALLSQSNPLCNGAATGSILLNASGGTPPYSYSANGQNFQPAALLSGLPAGTYSPTIRDANGCLWTSSITLSQPPPLVAQFPSVRNATCSGGSNGAALVLGSGGTAPYQFSLAGGPFSANAFFSSLPAGSYSVQVRDANLCLSAATFNIGQPPPLGLSLDSLRPVDCFGNASGYASFSGTGGQGGYAYGFNGGPLGSQSAFGGLAAGTYAVLIRDDSACERLLSFQVPEPPPLVLQAPQVQQVDCAGNSSGAVQLAAAGGTAPYLYALGSSPFQPAPLFDSLAAGSYTFSVRDTNLCLASLSISISEPPPLSIGVTGRQDVDCLGNASGSLSVAGGGGSPPYLFTINGGPPQAGGTFSSLFAGFYTLEAQDQNGCRASVDTIVSTPTGLVAGIDTLIPVACFGDSSASVLFRAIGGTQPYAYSFDGVQFFPGPLFSSLPALSDTVIMQDANGCIVPIPLSISEPPPLLFSAAVLQDVACFGDSSGRIEVGASGGTSPYLFQYPGITPSSDSIFSQLPAGSYFLSASDAQGCQARDTLAIAQPDSLVLSLLSQKNIDCFGNASGAVFLQASGGAGAYLFQLDSGLLQTGGLFANLAAGSYLLSVRDDSACVSSLAVQISQPDSLSLGVAAFEAIDCFGDSSGSVQLAFSGGSGGTLFSMNAGPFQPSPLFSQLPAGSYVFTARDDSSCTASVSQVLGERPLLLPQVVRQQDVDCFGNQNGAFSLAASGGAGAYVFSVNGQPFSSDTLYAGLAPGSYAVRVRDSLGCEQALAAVQIIEPPLLRLRLEGQDPSCYGFRNGFVRAFAEGGSPGYRYDWSHDPSEQDSLAQGLGAGSYQLILSDRNGCQARDSLRLGQPDTLAAQRDRVETAWCDWANGFASVRATGGTPAYAYAWSGLTVSGPEARDILGGAYVVTVTDAQGCQDSVQLVVPNVPPALPAFATLPDAGEPILRSQANVLFLNQSQGAVAYAWDFGDGSFSDESDPQHFYPNEGQYAVTLTAYNAYFDCPRDTTLILTIVPDGALFVPTAFTPNGDGLNDFFQALGEGIVEMELIIFDRWGREIIRLNSPQDRWDGSFQGEPVQEGVYVWALRARLNSGFRTERGGTVTLLR